IGSEAASIAGHLALGNLCWIYDSNRITIEGKTDLAFSEDVAARFRAYGWATQHVADANDVPAIRRALEAARAEKGKPTLVVVDSHIGYGSPKKQDTAGARGAKLSAEWVAKMDRFTSQFPDLAAELERMENGELPPGWDQGAPLYPP